MEKIRGFDDKAMDLVRLLVDYGWTGRVTSKGHWLGKAPDGKTTITVPSKMDNASRAEANAKAVFKKWVKDTYPDVAEALDRVEDEDDPIVQDILEGRAKKRVTKIANEALIEQQVKQFEAAMHAVEWPVRTPWLAHKASNKDGGVRYESEAVIQRTWNNGDVDYECAFEGCGYSNKNPRSVAVHYGRSHTMKGEALPAAQDKGLVVDPEYTEPIMERNYKPTDRLILALAAVLEKLNGHGTDREKAEEILRWFHDRPDLVEWRTNQEGDDDGLHRIWLRVEGEGFLVVREALQHALAGGVFDRWLHEQGASAETLLEALRQMEEVRGPADGSGTFVRLGEPIVEARDFVPAGALPAWTPAGTLRGWLWPTRAGVGVRRGGPGRGDGLPQSDVLDGPIPLPADVPVVSLEDGRGGTELLRIIEGLIAGPIRSELEAVKVERDLALAQLAKVSRDLEGIKELIGEVGR